MSHATYVALSYGAALLLVGGLVLAIWRDGRARRAEIAALEAQGIRRRSAGRNEGMGA
ncbi:heme exporter protein CcmD [Pseudohoeflea coraliihabitans]|uniref:Heme exporter protein D n=1 Tax=Pseudohoeflea coraliihabitans TaxID=2860393 RepID=A0ABS6WL85_9HYPH|nr:heme exporter protein CcmD [Pseudohoeflea sp. DP4N28-3]MBW3096729.1 heme exporter protein CcmD [Pseudohoeflea sp. DP4N28-3]